MRKEIILLLEESSNQVYDEHGGYVGTLSTSPVFNQDTEDLVKVLIKHGVTPDDIIKLKNNGLIRSVE